jgi:tellurite resistance protein TerC
MDFSIIAIVIQLIFLEGILSIDNAAILGAMVNQNMNPSPGPSRSKEFLTHWINCLVRSEALHSALD